MFHHLFLLIAALAVFASASPIQESASPAIRAESIEFVSRADLGACTDAGVDVLIIAVGLVFPASGGGLCNCSSMHW